MHMTKTYYAFASYKNWFKNSSIKLNVFQTMYLYLHDKNCNLFLSKNYLLRYLSFTFLSNCCSFFWKPSCFRYMSYGSPDVRYTKISKLTPCKVKLAYYSKPLTDYGNLKVHVYAPDFMLDFIKRINTKVILWIKWNKNFY